MNDFIAFIHGPIEGTELIAVYNPGLVLLSYLVAAFAAYTALDFAARVSDSGSNALHARSWLIGGACAMGAGIWGMHFIAMLAFRIPIAVHYDFFITLLSLAVGILLSGFALAVVTRGSLPMRRLLAGGAIMGLGVVTMHYTGMAAMRMEAVMLYRPMLFLLSVLNAIVCSTVALWLVFHLGARSNLGHPVHYKIGAALVMGLAIAGMHYTAMYAGVCISPIPVGTVIAPLDPALQSLVVGGVALLFMSVLLAVSIQNQKVSSQLKRQNVQLTNEIAERRRAELAMEEAKNAAEAANLAKSQFLANMSHEIRTPMNGLLGMTNLLLSSPLSSEQRNHAQIIKSCGNALLTIINDILDFSKIEAGRLQLEQIRFPLDKLLDELMALFGSPAQAKGLELTLKVGDSVPKFLAGDPTRLRQVLINLVGNAIKFSEVGEIIIDVSLAIPSTLRFEVIDHGVGITPEQRGRLFKPFSQADGTTTRRYGGTGLGLAIAKNLTQLMGGEIGMESTPGQGSRFWFTFPFRPAGEQAAEQAEQAPIDVPAALSGRVLLAEDNPVNQSLAVAMLRAMGLQVTVVSDGREVVTECARGGYDLILMDCQMPEMDGFQATAEIRARESGRRIPIVALTANAMVGDRERCITAGMDDYLSKPFEEQDLRAVLANWLDPVPSGAHAPPAAQAPAEARGVLDEGALEKISAIDRAGTGLLLQVISQYLDNAEKLLEQMSTGIDKEDRTLTTRAVHTLKSSSANLGAWHLAELCKEMETQLRTASLEDPEQWIERIRREYAAVRAVLMQKRAA